MSGPDDDFGAELAESGDDRPGVDELEGNDYSGLLLRDDDELDDDLDDDDDDDDDDDSAADDETDDDYPDDATEDEIDLVAALYREDGQPAGQALSKEFANDLDGLIDALRRVPGEAGTLGLVCVDGDFFVLVRVRGKVVQVVLSDVLAALDWPVARDIADYLGVELPDEDDDSEPLGDLDLFADAGLSALELEALCLDEELEPLEVLETIVEKLGFADAYDKVAAAFDL